MYDASGATVRTHTHAPRLPLPVCVCECARRVCSCPYPSALCLIACDGSRKRCDKRGGRRTSIQPLSFKVKTKKTPDSGSLCLPPSSLFPSSLLLFFCLSHPSIQISAASLSPLHHCSIVGRAGDRESSCLGLLQREGC